MIANRKIIVARCYQLFRKWYLVLINLLGLSHTVVHYKRLWLALLWSLDVHVHLWLWLDLFVTRVR